MKTQDIIRDLHDSEINGEISWFYHDCWKVRIGDEFNGWGYVTIATSHKEAMKILKEAAILLYPHSEFARKYSDSRVARAMATTVPDPNDRLRDGAA